MRPERPRIVRCGPLAREFGPRGAAPEGPPVALSVDELEALRLADLLGLNQLEGAARMGISRPTFGRILERAHEKVARALVQARSLQIYGEVAPEGPPPHGGETMRLAIAITGRGNISQHFGQSHSFRIVDVGPEGPKVIEDRPNPHKGHGHHEQGGHEQGGHEHAHGEHGCQGGGCGGHGHGGGCGGHGGCGHGHDHAHGHEGGGGHGWLDMLGDCQAAITLGMGTGALEGLRRRGIRPIVLDQALNVDEAIALFGAGRL